MSVQTMDLVAVLSMDSNDARCMGLRKVADIMNAKRRDAGYRRLCDSIRHGGISSPILICRSRTGRPIVFNGHHRIAAALECGIKELPVTEDFLDSDDEDWTA
jgi:ParB-like chromosome segregation protein Spo0J